MNDPHPPPQQTQELVPERTQDAMFRGRVSLAQHRDGYRFSVDTVLLAHYAARLRPCAALDLGTGSGVLALLLADLWEHHFQKRPSMWGIECQEALAQLAHCNVEANQRGDQIQIVNADIRHWVWPHPAQERPRLIICNPPFFRVGSGRTSPLTERAFARHEQNGTLEELVSALARVLHPRGHFVLVYPALGCERLIAALLAAKLHMTHLQCVHPHHNAEASLILLTARHRASPLAISQPLFLYQGVEPRLNTRALDTILCGELLALPS